MVRFPSFTAIFASKEGKFSVVLISNSTFCCIFVVKQLFLHLFEGANLMKSYENKARNSSQLASSLYQACHR
ncbi:MAG: hypothetical protein K2I27_09965, partial [Bacteroides sp.]|nr:hypothetical protein [Bacteroides sp.]